MINTQPVNNGAYINIMEGDNMINTSKVNQSDIAAAEINNATVNKTNEEMIHKIMSRTGATKEQACEALAKNNNDLLDAIIYAERNYGAASGRRTQQTAAQPQQVQQQQAQQTAAQPQQVQQQQAQQTTAQPQQNQQQQAQQTSAQYYSANTGAQPDPAQYAFNEQKAETYKSIDIEGYLKKAYDLLFKNSLVISYKGTRQGAIPLIICLLALIVSFSTVLIAAFVSMFFGVSFRLSGEKLGNSKINLLFDALFGMANTLKTSFNNAATTQDNR